ncbi:hypothetical protein [Methanosarcina horonobensis]|uniref:hypothetical protein n=1 Tax=Methanosarcina horonobensis TaxID=418008 RepID=UPI0022B93B9F|nr:hypothetical protein [Methanosarcina horonobensis]
MFRKSGISEIMKASIERLGHELLSLALPGRQKFISATPVQSNIQQNKKSSIRSALWERKVYR